MNKPAHKEPSMDEILSSIRQIIADDDAAGVPRRPSIQAAEDPMEAAPASPAAAGADDRDLSDMLDDIEPLTLSATQIVDEAEAEDDIAGFSFDSILADTPVDEESEPEAAAAPGLVDPEDISFAPAAEDDDDDLPSFDPPEPPPKPAAEVVAAPAPKPAPKPAPEPVAEEEFDIPAFNPEAQAAPMPDATLSSDMASQLLEPTTQAAVRSSMTKLNGLGLGNAGATIESLMRDMLRPMLKEWLDENLPAVVERMVEKEIARVSRGE